MAHPLNSNPFFLIISKKSGNCKDFNLHFFPEKAMDILGNTLNSLLPLWYNEITKCGEGRRKEQT